MCIPHPAGDAGHWQPHFNIMVPLRDPELGVGRHSVPREALDDLRRAWSLEITAAGMGVRNTVQVFYEFRKDETRKAHAARYFARHFPGWRVWSQRVTWFGNWRGVDPVELDRFDPHHCPDCGTLYKQVDVVVIRPGEPLPPWALPRRAAPGG